MAKSTGRRQHRRNRAISPVLRPVAWSALLGAAVAVAFANPVYADPAKVPDAGTRPAPAGALQLPGVVAPPGTSPTPGASGVPLPPLLTGPLATKINAKEVELAGLGDQGLQLKHDHAIALAERTTAEREWNTAREVLAEAQEVAGSAAAEALKDAAGLPPGMFGSDLHGLSRLGGIQWGDQPGADTTSAARAVLDAQATEQTAHEVYLAADTRVRTLGTQLATTETARERVEAELLKLKRDNAEQLAVIEREQEALDQRLGNQFIGANAVAGKVAHPKALGAVRYALDQLGDPYQWGAEGPHRFDCSGLMWAAYRSVGYKKLPRVAKDQYYATRHKTVDRSALLPGDMIFFASSSSWTSVYHVGMYIGGGKMVHAPTTGDVVKIVTVRWSRFYAATRIYDAVPAPSTSPSPKPTPTPTPTPPPTQTPRPTPTPTEPDPTEPDPTEPDPTEPGGEATETAGPTVTTSGSTKPSTEASTEPTASATATPALIPIPSAGH